MGLRNWANEWVLQTFELTHLSNFPKFILYDAMANNALISNESIDWMPVIFFEVFLNYHYDNKTYSTQFLKIRQG